MNEFYYVFIKIGQIVMLICAISAGIEVYNKNKKSEMEKAINLLLFVLVYISMIFITLMYFIWTFEISVFQMLYWEHIKEVKKDWTTKKK